MNSEEYCNSTTAVFVPEGFDADDLRMIIRENSTCHWGRVWANLKTESSALAILVTSTT